MIVRKIINRSLHNNFVIQVQLRCLSTSIKMSKAPSSPSVTQNQANFSRFSANTILTGTDFIKISDYDCVGFDLDNTLLRYKLSEMISLEYDVLSRYLVEHKGYSAKYLLRPLKDDLDFLQKGLITDFARGNILKISFDGYIGKAAHGTRMLSETEIAEVYGEDRKWNATSKFCRDLLIAWQGDLSTEMRTLLDYFDMPSSLAFARIVDSLDAKNGNKPLERYDIWPDILDGLTEMFQREHFQNDRSAYFAEMKRNPAKYIHVTNDNVRNWLKQLKKEKTLFLLTGSHIDFANLTATYALGENWQDLFDIVVCFAKKPGFFSGQRPFKALNGFEETEQTVAADELKLGVTYSQGNWNDLMHCLSVKTKTDKPKVLYVGDNLLQDVYAPNKFCGSDTISIAEELLAEGMNNVDADHEDDDFLTSNTWGSYFTNNDEPSIWLDVIRKYSKICIPTISTLASQPIDHPFKCFTQKMCVNGFYPSEPQNLTN